MKKELENFIIESDIMTRKLKTWNFKKNNDKLIELVLSGKKTSTICLYDENDVSSINEESILIFDNEKKACVTKIKQVIITEFKNITKDLVMLEGEATFDEWKKDHIDYFKSINPKFNENTKVLFVIFEVKENLIEQRLEMAKKIAESNKDIFGNIESIEEINAGFNNSIFCINNKYIIKVCGNDEKENLFDVEVNFYNSNNDNDSIPKLYRYDKSKKIIPHVYEIIEKVSGKSLYYYWYKMPESEREKTIQKLIKVLKRIHSKEYESYDWCSLIKTKVLSYFNQTIDMFTEDEKRIILSSLENYDEILSDNKFCLIHNDLHFDNIILDDNGNIKLIDFNDSIIAPYDFDLRLLYMSVLLPWKWANIKMDPLQKPKDYKNLFEYIKKYYPTLSEIKYLEERMIIYSILNNFELLPRFRNKDDKKKIMSWSIKIMNFSKREAMLK